MRESAEVKATPWWRGPGRRTPPVLAVLIGTFGILSVVRVITPIGRRHLEDLIEFVPVPASASAAAVTAAAGVLLVLLAHGLWRRQRRAWRAALVLCLLIAVSHLLSKFSIVAALIAVLLALVLFLSRRHFYADGDPTTRLIAVRAIALILGLGFVLGMGILVVYDDRLVGHPTLLSKAWTVLLDLIGIAGPDSFASTRADLMFAFVLAAFGILAALVGAYLALRPLEPRPYLSPDDQCGIRQLLTRHGGRDSLGYFALREDKSVVWSQSRKAGVSYRVVAGVALASGDPVGDPEAWPQAIVPFLELCRVHAWTPAVVGCSQQGGVIYQRQGLAVLEIGDEAIVDASSFCLTGRSMRNVRQAVNRVQRSGYTASVRRLADIPMDELAAIARDADAWREGNTERGFSMALGRFGDPSDGECVVVTAHKGGALAALLNFVPWGADGLSLDLMRRDRAADNGLNELLIVQLLERCGELGIGRVSLNFAAFRSALARGEQLGAGPVSRVWSKLLVFASRWLQIESLYRFNAKFCPEWVPRYVCYPTSVSLLRIALAAMEAEAFWRRPRPFRALARQRLDDDPTPPTARPNDRAATTHT